MSKPQNEHCSSWIETADGKRVPNPDATNTTPNPGKSELQRRAAKARRNLDAPVEPSPEPKLNSKKTKD